MPTFSAAKLTQLAHDLFTAAGVPSEDAAIVANSLVDANLCGHDSHGMLRVPQYLDFLKQGIFKPGVAMTVLSETPAVLSADGNWGLGQVQAHRLLGKLIEKAAALGIAVGTLRNCGHIGRLGEYAETRPRGEWLSSGPSTRMAAGDASCPPVAPTAASAPTRSAWVPRPPPLRSCSTSAPVPWPRGRCDSRCKRRNACPRAGSSIMRESRPPIPACSTSNRVGTSCRSGAADVQGLRPRVARRSVLRRALGRSVQQPGFPTRRPGQRRRFHPDRPGSSGRHRALHPRNRWPHRVRAVVSHGGRRGGITLPGDPERHAKQQRAKDGIPLPDGTWDLIAKAARELNVLLPA